MGVGFSFFIIISLTESHCARIEHIAKAKKTQGKLKRIQKESIVSSQSASGQAMHEADLQWRKEILLGRKKASEIKDKTIGVVSSATKLRATQHENTQKELPSNNRNEEVRDTRTDLDYSS